MLWEPDCISNCRESTSTSVYSDANLYFAGASLFEGLYWLRDLSATMEEWSETLASSLHTYDALRYAGQLQKILQDAEWMIAEHGCHAVFGQNWVPTSLTTIILCLECQLGGERSSLPPVHDLMKSFHRHLNAKCDGKQELRRLQKYAIGHLKDNGGAGNFNGPTTAEQVKMLVDIVHDEALEWHFDYFSIPLEMCDAIVQAAIDVHRQIFDNSILPQNETIIALFKCLNDPNEDEYDVEEAWSSLQTKIGKIILTASDKYISKAETETGISWTRRPHGEKVWMPAQQMHES